MTKGIQRLFNVSLYNEEGTYNIELCIPCVVRFVFEYKIYKIQKIMIINIYNIRMLQIYDIYILYNLNFSIKCLYGVLLEFYNIAIVDCQKQSQPTTSSACICML